MVKPHNHQSETTGRPRARRTFESFYHQPAFEWISERESVSREGVVLELLVILPMLIPQSASSTQFTIWGPLNKHTGNRCNSQASSSSSWWACQRRACNLLVLYFPAARSDWTPTNSFHSRSSSLNCGNDEMTSDLWVKPAIKVCQKNFMFTPSGHSGNLRGKHLQNVQHKHFLPLLLYSSSYSWGDFKRWSLNLWWTS